MVPILAYMKLLRELSHHKEHRKSIYELIHNLPTASFKNLVIYNVIIDVFGRIGDVVEMKKYYDYLIEQGEK